MKPALLLLCLIITLTSGADILNLMGCGQSLIKGLNILSVMGNYISGDNFHIFEAAIRAFAFETTQMKKFCGIQFDISDDTPYDEQACMKYTRTLYFNLQPFTERPYDIFTDVDAIQNTMKNFGNVLKSCGINPDDEKNQKIEEIISEDNVIDLDKLTPIMVNNAQISPARPNRYRNPPKMGGVELEYS